MRNAALLGVQSGAAVMCWVSFTPSLARRSMFGVLKAQPALSDINHRAFKGMGMRNNTLTSVLGNFFYLNYFIFILFYSRLDISFFFLFPSLKKKKAIWINFKAIIPSYFLGVMEAVHERHPTATEEKNSCHEDDLMLEVEPCRDACQKLASWCQSG